MTHAPRRSTTRRSLAVLALAALFGCGDAADDAGTSTEVAAEYAAELGVDLEQSTRSATGLYVRELAEGSGAAAAAGDTVVVHYTGWLPDGTQFDSSRDRGEPFEIPLGAGVVIPGWDEGLQGMRVGGQRQLVIPPALAYGSRGAGNAVPPNATLVFEVELLEVR